MCYGSGNKWGGMIGVSAGDGQNCLLSSLSESGSMKNAADILFILPVSRLPDGVSCSPSGALSGVPTLAGTSIVSFVVQDRVGSVARRDLGIVVLANANKRPVIDSCTPASGSYAMLEETNQFFQVVAHDPEAGGLTYSWTWDGASVGGDSGSYTHFTVWGDAGMHTLRCHVSDSLWTNVVFAEWNVTVSNHELIVTTESLPDGMEMVPYNFALQATNGPHPYVWSVAPPIAAWGDNWGGQCDVPTGLTDVVAIAAGWEHNLTLKSDRTVVAWGDNGGGQCDVPPELTDVVAVSVGAWHSLALKSDGTVVAWGSSETGAIDIPQDIGGVARISSGYNHVLALRSGLPEGLSCSEEGVVSGIPILAGTSLVSFVVHDDVGVSASKTLRIAISANPE